MNAGTAFALVVAGPLWLTAGCSLLSVSDQENINRYAKKVADTYCTQPYQVRSEVTRPAVNLAIAPNKIRMDCYGDPDNPIVVPVTPAK